MTKTIQETGRKSSETAKGLRKSDNPSLIPETCVKKKKKDSVWQDGSVGKALAARLDD